VKKKILLSQTAPQPITTEHLAKRHSESPLQPSSSQGIRPIQFPLLQRLGPGSAFEGFRVIRGVFLSIVLAASLGCASTKPSPRHEIPPEKTYFEKVGIIDFRKDTLDDYQKLVRPGDLIVNYMRLGRAAKKREWLFAVLPHGHSMVVLDPYSPDGILECRFHGARYVGPDELKLYSYNTVYRLKDADRLDQTRLREFADHAVRHCKTYSFKSWLTLNDALLPDHLGAVSPKYTCSTMVVAAYHYAGLTLDVSEPANRVVTPLSIAASAGRFSTPATPESASRPTIVAKPLSPASATSTPSPSSADPSAAPPSSRR
jgi:hypothetical protein